MFGEWVWCFGEMSGVQLYTFFNLLFDLLADILLFCVNEVFLSLFFLKCIQFSWLSLLLSIRDNAA